MTPSLPIDAHPYEHRHPELVVRKAYAVELTKIAKLPFDERKPARAELEVKFKAELEKVQSNDW